MRTLSEAVDISCDLVSQGIVCFCNRGCGKEGWNWGCGEGVRGTGVCGAEGCKHGAPTTKAIVAAT